MKEKAGKHVSDPDKAFPSKELPFKEKDLCSFVEEEAVRIVVEEFVIDIAVLEVTDITRTAKRLDVTE